MLHGGYAQLKMILDNAKKPLTPEQERQARALYDELNQEVKQIPRDSKGAPDRMQLDKAENSALTKVVQLLTPEQRQVLVDSRQSSVNRLPR
jgi:Spy/CpxP family protein refolding chaperone